jgi:hypothetical protein
MSDSAQDDAAPGLAEATAGTADAPPAADGPQAGAAPEDDGDMPDLDDVKRHFREALERKNQANAKEASASGGKAKGKAQGAHGPASTRRSFRRKSG